jgi:hypothetical protein
MPEFESGRVFYPTRDFWFVVTCRDLDPVGPKSKRVWARCGPVGGRITCAVTFALAG